MTPDELRGEFDRELLELVNRCAAQDRTALAHLRALSLPHVYRVLIKILRRQALADEAAQEVFFRVWQHAAKFDVTRGSAIGWIRAIARNVAIDMIRVDRPFKYSEADIDTVEDEHIEPVRMSVTLQHCLKRLTPQQVEFLELSFLEGHSHTEIAQLTGQPVGSVKSYMRRGLSKLRTCLESVAPKDAPVIVKEIAKAAPRPRSFLKNLKVTS